MANYTGHIRNQRLEVMYQNRVYLQLDLSDICQRANIPYNGQPARMNGDNLEIAPARTGGLGVQIPLEMLVLQYAAQPHTPSTLQRFNSAAYKALKKLLKKIFWEEY